MADLAEGRVCRVVGLTPKFDNRPGHVGHDHSCGRNLGHDGYHVCALCREMYDSHIRRQEPRR